MNPSVYFEIGILDNTRSGRIISCSLNDLALFWF